MIRIRTGASWRHDPALRGVSTRATRRARAAVARALVDALVIEVDGIDIAAGRAEGPLLPSLEALLRAIARVVAGAPHATVSFEEGEIEILLRRLGRSVLLTVVGISRPSRILARDVEVDAEELAAAALDACAQFCRELAQVLPEASSSEARRLRAAARVLRRVDTGSAPRPPASAPARSPRQAARCGEVVFRLEIGDDGGLLAGYEGGRPDLGSLLVPGRLSLLASGAEEICSVPGLPFLALRDLGAASDGLVDAVRRGEASFSMGLPRTGRGEPGAIAVDLARRTVAGPGRSAIACAPLDLARAVSEAAAEFGRVARSRNPRQAENVHLAELEAAAADRLAQIDELAEGERVGVGGRPARLVLARPNPQRALGPGTLRHLSFRRVFAADVGPPAGEGLFLAGGAVVAAGSTAVVAIERGSGAARWRADGCSFAAPLPGMLLVARGDVLAAIAVRTGATLWARPLPGGPPSQAVAMQRGPVVLVEAGALTGLEPRSGHTLWRLEPPGAPRLRAAVFGGIAAAAADNGTLYGVDAAGRIAWRLRAGGPFVGAPAATAGACLAVAATGRGASILALDPASGIRAWEAPLDFVPAGAPVGWGRRVVAAGAMAGDPVVTALERTGTPAWTAGPSQLSGAPRLAVGGSVLVARDPKGTVVALGRDGRVEWIRPARPDHAETGSAPPAAARGTVVVPAGDGLAALHARTGEIVGAIRGIAASRLAVDASLGIAAMDGDGFAAGWRIATHLSVL